MDAGGIDPSQLPNASSWGPYAVFALAGGAVIWVLKQGKELFGWGKKEPEPAHPPHHDGGELRSLITAGFSDMGDRIKEVRDDLKAHAAADERRDQRRADQIGDIFIKLGEHGEDLATLKAYREQWESGKGDRRGAR